MLGSDSRGRAVAGVTQAISIVRAALTLYPNPNPGGVAHAISIVRAAVAAGADGGAERGASDGDRRGTGADDGERGCGAGGRGGA